MEGALLDTLVLWARLGSAVGLGKDGCRLEHFVLRTRLDIGTVLLFGCTAFGPGVEEALRFGFGRSTLDLEVEAVCLPRFVDMLLLLCSILHICCRRSCSRSILLRVPSCCRGCCRSMMLALRIGSRLIVFRP